MLRVGLVGEVASGKSAVAERLAQAGLPVLDADRVAHELYAPGTDLADAIVSEFGDDVRGEDGGIDRSVLGRIVFADPARLAKLESMVHPPLLLEVARRMEALAEDGETAVVLEAALLLGWHGAPVDLMVGVIAGRERRRDRLRRRGWSAETIEARLDAQTDEREIRERADWIVENNGTLEDLDWSASVLARRIRERALEGK